MAAHQINILAGPADKVAVKATQTNIASLAAGTIMIIQIDDTSSKAEVLRAFDIAKQVVLEQGWPMTP